VSGEPQWTCTREQMADAVANIRVRVLKSGPAAGLIVAEDFTDAILSQLPEVPPGSLTVSREDLRALLGITLRAEWLRGTIFEPAIAARDRLAAAASAS